jgi:Glycosyltransferases, probably involved in cell wall biogenesis
MSPWLWLALPGAVIWIGVLLAPWRPWSTREHLEPEVDGPLPDLSAVTVLIPARDEAEVIEQTLRALACQGRGLRICVIDDQSGDGTDVIARRFEGVELLRGRPLPAGWAGKLWALEQGLARVQTPLTLLLDADIALAPGMLARLLRFKRERSVALVSLMAWLKMASVWDRLLLPAFVYYFKLLYPFALANAARPRWLAAAAGGCVLVDTEALRAIGAFAGLRDALIDDCTLATRIKASGRRTWVGLSRGVFSLRPYGSLSSIHQMVARSAFTQLRYSTSLLLVVTLLFAGAYWLPLAALALPSARGLAGIAVLAMLLGYLPTLVYYRLQPFWALALPLTGTLFLAMTWSSALRYWRGTRSSWKGRSYAR